jgi:hypothetical protein
MIKLRRPVFRRPAPGVWKAGPWAALAAIALPLWAAAPAPAEAADQRLLGNFGEWTAYADTESGGKICFMIAQPRKAEGDYSQRGDIHTMITHRPGEKSFNVINIVAGYPYKEQSEVELSVGRKTWSLFTQGERAWAYDSDDPKIVEAIRQGSTMVVKGTSSRGTLTTDTYSLTGSNAAYQAISRECGVKVD